MALVLKKLVSRSSSVVVPYLRRSPNHSRHFIAEVGSILKEVLRRIVFECPSNMAPKFAKRLLYCVPHTLRVTSRVRVKDIEDEDEDEEGLSGGDTLGTRMKFSLNIPGIEKFTDTRENLYIFIDMGLPKNLVLDDLDTFVFNFKLIEDIGLNNLLAMDGFVQKLNIRRQYTAIVPLPPNIKAAPSSSFFVEPENGGLVVKIPKLLTGSSSSTSSSSSSSSSDDDDDLNHCVQFFVDAARCFLGLMRKMLEDKVVCILGLMRKMLEDKRCSTVDFRWVNSGREIHGHLRLAVEDRDKNFKVLLRGRILMIKGDDGKIRNSFAEVPTRCFKSSEVVAIKQRGYIKVIFPLTMEKVKHDVRLLVEVPFV